MRFYFVLGKWPKWLNKFNRILYCQSSKSSLRKTSYKMKKKMKCWHFGNIWFSRLALFLAACTWTDMRILTSLSSDYFTRFRARGKSDIRFRHFFAFNAFRFFEARTISWEQQLFATWPSSFWITSTKGAKVFSDRNHVWFSRVPDHTKWSREPGAFRAADLNKCLERANCFELLPARH